MNIILKNLPEPVYQAIKRAARQNRRSVNEEILRVLEVAASEAERRGSFAALREELDRFAASLPPLDDSAPLIRRDRER